MCRCVATGSVGERATTPLDSEAKRKSRLGKEAIAAVAVRRSDAA